jgi:hypothetical protein
VILRIVVLARKTLAVVLAWLGGGPDSTAEPLHFFHAISTENFVDNIFDEVYASQLIIAF